MTAGLNLKPYIPFARSVMQTYLSYGVNAVVFMLGGFLRVFLAYYLWMAIYDSSGQGMIQGFTRLDMAVYVVIMEFIIRLTFASEADRWVGDEVRSGAIAMNLIKPISYTGRMMAMSLGGLVYELVVVFLPLGVFFGLVGYFALGWIPPDAVQVAAFFLSVLLGFLILFSMNMAFGFMAFYLKNLWGLSNLRYGIVSFLSGAVIPLSFFPEGMKKVVEVLPFSAMHYTPVMIFLGKISGSELWAALAIQAFWAVVFFAGCQWVFRGAVKHLTVQGG